MKRSRTGNKAALKRHKSVQDEQTGHHTTATGGHRTRYQSPRTCPNPGKYSVLALLKNQSIPRCNLNQNACIVSNTGVNGQTPDNGEKNHAESVNGYGNGMCTSITGVVSYSHNYNTRNSNAVNNLNNQSIRYRANVETAQLMFQGNNNGKNMTGSGKDIAESAENDTNSGNTSSTSESPRSSLEADALSLEEEPMDDIESNIATSQDESHDAKENDSVDNTVNAANGCSYSTYSCGFAQSTPNAYMSGTVIASAGERFGPMLSGENLETDIIYTRDVHQTHLSSPPPGIAQDFGDSKPQIPGNEHLIVAFFKSKKPNECNELWITHMYSTDSELGDSFGAKLESFIDKDYTRHIFRNIQPDSPADKMKIKDGDELVSFKDGSNDQFAPVMSHTDILNFFHHIKVDGKTRLVLVIRRIEKKKWQWYESSAILAPDTRYVKHHTLVEHPKMEPVKDNRRTYTEQKKFKVENTELYLDLQATGVTTSPLYSDQSDRTKIITKETTIRQDQTTGDYRYYCTLCGCDNKSYLTVHHQRIYIQTEKPNEPFEWKKLSTRVWFLLEGKYICCQNGKVTVSDDLYYFDECPPDNGMDHADLAGAMSSNDSFDSGYSTPDHPQNGSQPARDRGRNITTARRRLVIKRQSTVDLSGPMSDMLVKSP